MQELRVVMRLKSFFASLILAFLSSSCVQSPLASKNGTSCSYLSQAYPDLKFVEFPVLILAVAPSEGAYEISMRAPIDGANNRIVPSSLSQSNCLLDEMLDSKIKAALLSAANAISWPKDGAPDIVFDEYLNAAAGPLGDALGTTSEHGRGYFTGILVNIEEVFELRSGRQPNTDPLLRHFHRRGIYDPIQIDWIVLMSFVKHLGAQGLDLELFYQPQSQDETEP
jgi:hypothetical protein